MQHRQQQGQPTRLESDGDTARVHRLRIVDQRLQFDEQRTATLADDGDDAAGHRRGMARQENRRRIAHFAQALLGHHEDTQLIGGAKPILDCAHDPETTTGIALEIEHGIDHVLENARAGDQALPW